MLKALAAGTETRAAIRGMAAGRTAEARKKVAEPRAATRSKEAEGILERIGEVCWLLDEDEAVGSGVVRVDGSCFFAVEMTLSVSA